MRPEMRALFLPHFSSSGTRDVVHGARLALNTGFLADLASVTDDFLMIEGMVGGGRGFDRLSIANEHASEYQAGHPDCISKADLSGKGPGSQCSGQPDRRWHAQLPRPVLLPNRTVLGSDGSRTSSGHRCARQSVTRPSSGAEKVPPPGEGVGFAPELGRFGF